MQEADAGGVDIGGADADGGAAVGEGADEEKGPPFKNLSSSLIEVIFNPCRYLHNYVLASLGTTSLDAQIASPGANPDSGNLEYQVQILLIAKYVKGYKRGVRC